MDTYFDLGDFHWEISTRSDQAQIWFNRGMIWSFAFHHEEAIRCFHKVIFHDPHCAMGYWGHAYAAGPNYNLPWPLFDETRLAATMVEIRACLAEANRLLASASPVERAVIEALNSRVQSDLVVDELAFAAWDQAYANAMRLVQQTFPHDADVAFLTVEALMCQTPWLLWDLQSGLPGRGAATIEALDIVEEALVNNPFHPGLLHLHIHLLEMSSVPERALESSHKLRQLVPDAGHLIHMPSHIYILCGKHELALDCNSEAIQADSKYANYHNELGLFTLYRCHNFHFKIYAAMFLGQFEPALTTAEALKAIIPRAAITHEHAFLASTLEGFCAIKAHVLIRFGRWREIIDEPLPTEPELYTFTTAMWQYAKGVAYAALGEIALAEEATKHFEQACQRVPPERLLFNNNCREILGVGAAMLAGELAYRKGDFAEAFNHLRESVRRYDNLAFTEPWAWMQPTRHALGALLLEQGHIDEAADTYRADLGLNDSCIRAAQHPDNIWSLFGYADCLKRQQRWAELEAIQAKLDIALSLKDVEVHASCFCQLKDDCC